MGCDGSKASPSQALTTETTLLPATGTANGINPSTEPQKDAVTKTSGEDPAKTQGFQEMRQQPTLHFAAAEMEMAKNRVKNMPAENRDDQAFVDEQFEEAWTQMIKKLQVGQNATKHMMFEQMRLTYQTCTSAPRKLRDDFMQDYSGQEREEMMAEWENDIPGGRDKFFLERAKVFSSLKANSDSSQPKCFRMLSVPHIPDYSKLDLASLNILNQSQMFLDVLKFYDLKLLYVTIRSRDLPSFVNFAAFANALTTKSIQICRTVYRESYCDGNATHSTDQPETTKSDHFKKIIESQLDAEFLVFYPLGWETKASFRRRWVDAMMMQIHDIERDQVQQGEKKEFREELFRDTGEFRKKLFQVFMRYRRVASLEGMSKPLGQDNNQQLWQNHTGTQVVASEEQKRDIFYNLVKGEIMSDWISVVSQQGVDPELWPRLFWEQLEDDSTKKVEHLPHLICPEKLKALLFTSTDPPSFYHDRVDGQASKKLKRLCAGFLGLGWELNSDFITAIEKGYQNLQRFYDHDGAIAAQFEDEVFMPFPCLQESHPLQRSPRSLLTMSREQFEQAPFRKYVHDKIMINGTERSFLEEHTADIQEISGQEFTPEGFTAKLSAQHVGLVVLDYQGELKMVPKEHYKEYALGLEYLVNPNDQAFQAHDAMKIFLQLQELAACEVQASERQQRFAQYDQEYGKSTSAWIQILEELASDIEALLQANAESPGDSDGAVAHQKHWDASLLQVVQVRVQRFMTQWLDREFKKFGLQMDLDGCAQFHLVALFVTWSITFKRSIEKLMAEREQWRQNFTKSVSTDVEMVSE